jgi:hypothetical protein
MRPPIRIGSVGIACILAASWLRAEEPPHPALGQTFASVVALAAAQHIQLEGIDPPQDTQLLRPGDTLTVLFTLTDKRHSQQWLAEINVVPLTEEERRAKPREDVLYSGTGNEYHLNSPPAAFALRIFGPLRDTDTSNQPAKPVVEKHARFLVQQDFLSFGFDRYCELVLRLRGLGQEPRLGVMTGRFPEKDIAWFKQWAEQARFTRDDELICVKQAFAMVEFLKIAQRTPGFEQIAKATVEIPSIWSVLKTWNIGMNFSIDFKNVKRFEADSKEMAASIVYSLPFSLTMFGKHVANGTWLATAARPPLLASAGVLCLTVGPPDNKEKHLQLRVIAARNAQP